MEEKYKINFNGTLPDEEIIELYWSRDEKAITETDKKYGNYLYTIASNIIDDRMDCEECVNDTYLGTWNRIPPTRPNVFHAFLAKITRNIAVSRFRKNAAKKRIPSEMQLSLEEFEDCTISNPSAEDEYLVKRVAEILNDYINNLSRRKELIFVCRYYYADRIVNISKMLGISEKTVYRELEEIRQGLKELLEKEGFPFEKQ